MAGSSPALPTTIPATPGFPHPHYPKIKIKGYFPYAVSVVDHNETPSRSRRWTVSAPE
jgi:hypothetical protein